MRRTDKYLSSIEHVQRVISMDWTTQNHSIVTLSMDNSLRVFSTNGQLLAESTPNEQLPFTLSKVLKKDFLIINIGHISRCGCHGT